MFTRLLVLFSLVVAHAAGYAGKREIVSGTDRMDRDVGRIWKSLTNEQAESYVSEPESESDGPKKEVERVSFEDLTKMEKDDALVDLQKDLVDDESVVSETPSETVESKKEEEVERLSYDEWTKMEKDREQVDIITENDRATDIEKRSNPGDLKYKRDVSVYPSGKNWKRASDFDEGSGEDENSKMFEELHLVSDKRSVNVLEQPRNSGSFLRNFLSAHQNVDNEEDIEGSGEMSVRVRRQLEGNSAEIFPLIQTAPEVAPIAQPPVLGMEVPVEPSAPVALAQRGGRRDDSDDHDSEDRRHRPDSNTCATVDCRSGMVCVMERGRPSCVPSNNTPSCLTARCASGTTCVMERGRPTCVPDRQPQRTCRDVNCPRDSRCRMEGDPRCSGFRNCDEQPVCVRDSSSSASCSRVQCPAGTSCRVVEEPGCFGRNCREIATCVSACDRVRCPVGTVCRTDGFGQPSCIPIAINPCLSVRCPSGFQCQSVQNQPRCFPIFTNPPTTTTPAPPSTCFVANEEFKTCASLCEPTCANKTQACILSCAHSRCQCAAGFYRNEVGQCVRAEQCEPSTQICRANEVFNSCASACEPKCGQPVPMACTLQCLPGQCQCMQGFFRHANGSCVQQHQCFAG